MPCGSPSEASHQNWLHACIVAYFEARAFRVDTSSPTARKEKERPYDLQVRVRKGNIIKRFGLQIKRPHEDGIGTYWGLNRQQHSTMQAFTWIFYALPTFTDSTLQHVACHHVLITPRYISYRPRVRVQNLGRRFRWGGFAEGIAKCTAGQRLDPTLAETTLESLALESRLVNSILADVDLTQRIVEVLITGAEAEAEPSRED